MKKEREREKKLLKTKLESKHTPQEGNGKTRVGKAESQICQGLLSFSAKRPKTQLGLAPHRGAGTFRPIKLLSEARRAELGRGALIPSRRG